MALEEKQRLVLIGNGMAGLQTLEHIRKLHPERYEMTVIGSEPHPNYNRMRLADLLGGGKRLSELVLNDWSWYTENRILLFAGTTVTSIDIAKRLVRTDSGLELPYDVLILATGSSPESLPLPGADLNGIVGFRDIQDCDHMAAAARHARRAAVLGGGLLGLEAARGLRQLGLDVTVVHPMPTLMERQLDATAAGMLQAELERQGLRFKLEAEATELYGSRQVQGLRFADGGTMEADLVVMASGIRPNMELAADAGLAVNRGILVNDYMETSAPGVYAVGECIEHRGTCYGMAAPLFEQAAVLAKRLCGVQTPPYTGSAMAVHLTLSDVEIFTAGEFLEREGLSVLKVHDPEKRTYHKILLDGSTVVGGILYGDVAESARLAKWVKERFRLSETTAASEADYSARGETVYLGV